MGMVKEKKIDQSQRHINCYISGGLFNKEYWDKCLDNWEKNEQIVFLPHGLHQTKS